VVFFVALDPCSCWLQPFKFPLVQECSQSQPLQLPLFKAGQLTPLVQNKHLFSGENGFTSTRSMSQRSHPETLTPV
jgi:hypothetical protein